MVRPTRAQIRTCVKRLSGGTGLLCVRGSRLTEDLMHQEGKTSETVNHNGLLYRELPNTVVGKGRG